ncbi:hypothetical protein BN1708_016931, partial [Verticillium longisporum]
MAFTTDFGHLKSGEHNKDKILRVGARIYNKRASGSKLVFYDVRVEGVKVQVMCQAQEVTGDLDALQTFISGYGGEDDKEDAPDGSKPRQKISFKDLGLAGVKDPQMKKSMKLMSKEEKEARPGGAKKLAIPLGKRQQDKLSRAVAYEKTNETLDRWTDRVKQDRRAEHLVFPLPENAQ